jgi:hypothetical protein
VADSDCGACWGLYPYFDSYTLAKMGEEEESGGYCHVC